MQWHLPCTASPSLVCLQRRSNRAPSALHAALLLQLSPVLVLAAVTASADCVKPQAPATAFVLDSTSLPLCISTSDWEVSQHESH
jgi:hypothetical protein